MVDHKSRDTIESASVPSARLLELLFDRMPMGIAVLDREFNLLRYNPTWNEFSKRYRPAKGVPLAIGVNYFDHLPGAEPNVLPLFQRVLQGETVEQSSVRLDAGGITSFWDIVIAPLIEDGEIVGILNVSVDATERVEAQKHLEQRVKERTAELNRRRKIAESFLEIIAVLNSSQSMDDTLATITQRACQVLRSQACLIHHIEEKTGFVAIQASHGLPEELKGFAGFPLGTSKSADDKILNREPVWVDDFGTLPKLDSQLIASLPAEVRRWRELTNQYFQAWLAVPLVVADQVYGSMAFYYNTPTTFDQDEIALSQSFADQAALAIENAQLYKEIERASIAAERNRLARDLHDAVTQTLFSASMIADVLPKIWERDPDEGQRRLGELRQLTRGALSEMRTLLVELRPTALADTNLGDLVNHQVNAFTARTGLGVTFNRQCNDNLPAEVKEMFYRIAQEALNNIAKHAGASNVQIELTCTSDETILIIKDDGMGFDPDLREGEGLGLGIMRERARNAGAILKLDSQIGKGTCLEVHWPEPNTKEH